MLTTSKVCVIVAKCEGTKTTFINAVQRRAVLKLRYQCCVNFIIIIWVNINVNKIKAIKYISYLSTRSRLR